MNPSHGGRLRSRAAALAMAAACVCAAVASGGGGALDVELRNRTLVTGSIREPHELDTVRVRMPTGAALAVTLRGKGKLQPGVRLFDEAGLELDLGASIRRGGKTTTILPFTPGPAGLYRLDVRGDGDVTGDYTLDAGWKLPPKESFAGTTGSDGGYYVFEAEAGTRIDVALRGLDAGATARVTRVTGPRGYELTIKPPKRLGAVHHVVTPALPVSGRYEVEFVTDVGGRSISGTLGRKPSTKKLRQNLRRADVRRAGVARTVSRIFAQDGGGVDVGGLDTDQRVSLDVSGVSLAVPAGTVSYASSFAIRSDDDAINDPLGFAPAGVSVNFDAGKLQLASEVTVRLPYDVGAFTSGDVFSDICILHREADGQVGEISRSSATVDPNAGTVSFPTSRFSSFQVFSPPVELTVVATPGRPNDLAGAPDEEVVYVSTDFLTADLPAAAVLRYSASGGVETYAGGGSKTGDFVNRLDFDFDHDLGLHGVYISSIAAASDGAVFVVTSDQDRTWSMVYFVQIDGTVIRTAGNGTPDLDESLPSRETGLPFCTGVGYRPGGSIVIVSNSIPYPQSDRVFEIYNADIYLDTFRIRTVAGGGVHDVSGFTPLETRLYHPRSIVVDSQDRILVGDEDWLVRFDLAASTTTTLAGTNFGETKAGRTLGGVGAPLRTVVLGTLDDIDFVPGRDDDIVYAADAEAGIVWRFDLVRDRAFIAAGRRVGFDKELTTRDPDPSLVDPNAPLNFPVAVAPVRGEVFIADRYSDRLFSLHRKR